MTRRRRLVGAAGWTVGMAVAATALGVSGRGALAGPALADPGRWAQWLDGRDPVVAAVALVRMAALGALWYLVAVTVVGTVLRLIGAVRMVAWADRLTIGPVRRALAGSVGLGLAASGVLGVVAPVAVLPAALAAQTASPQTATGVPATVTMHQLSPTEPAPAARTPSSRPEVTPAAATAADRWTVEPGQCFWSIAESVLDAHLGRAVSDAEIVPYWRRLIAVNRSRLVDRDNADLIHPGQVFEVPAP